MNGGLPATQHIKQEALPDYRAMTEARAPLSAHCRAPPAAGPHADLDLPGRGLANPASSCYLLGSEPSPGLGPPPEARLPEGSLKRCCLLGLPPASSASSSPCASSDITSIILSSQTALVTCVNGLRSPPLPGDLGAPPKRSRPGPAPSESLGGSLQLEACRRAGFLKQEPSDEFSELFGPHQQGLPPPYPLSQVPPGPGLGGLGLGLAGRVVAGRQACRWVDCCAAYEQQEELVRHIEKSHIDQRKGEDFTCFWAGCVRRYKPFNARYKLLIHMRVHSGEKPNKCMVSFPATRPCPSPRGRAGPPAYRQKSTWNSFLGGWLRRPVVEEGRSSAMDVTMVKAVSVPVTGNLGRGPLVLARCPIPHPPCPRVGHTSSGGHTTSEVRACTASLPLTHRWPVSPCRWPSESWGTRSPAARALPLLSFLGRLLEQARLPPRSSGSSQACTVRALGLQNRLWGQAKEWQIRPWIALAVFWLGLRVRFPGIHRYTQNHTHLL